MSLNVHIIKVGGSLLDLPQLAWRLMSVIDDSDADCQLLVVGGGRSVDVVRHWESLHHVGEETCHWLCLRAMQLNSHLLQTVLPGSKQVSDPAQLQISRVHLLDPIAWLEDEQSRNITIPHVWQFTSDSIAAHLAKQLHASRLTLCKSTLLEHECGLSCAASLGIVDECFPEAAAGLEHVELINLRDEAMPVMVLNHDKAQG